MMPTVHGILRVVRGGLAVVLLVSLVACGGTPKWVSQGSGVMNNKDDKAFYGVGSIIGIKNEPLAWDAAENRARAEIAKNFQTYTAYLMKDYAASTTANDFTKSTEEQNVERAIKTFSAVTLNGVRPVERYKDEDSGTYYVLAKLDLKDVKNKLEESKELNAEVRDFVRKNADRLFEKLEKEETKQAPK
jgi:LPP20 lipoprotein